ncbi:hypothetical protein GX586_06780, partial [bacterium]|nr:hypothetical protein [bacterium]
THCTGGGSDGYQQYYEQNADGSFTCHTLTNLVWSQAVALTDEDGDGDLDIIATATGVGELGIWEQIGGSDLPPEISVSPVEQTVAVGHAAVVGIACSGDEGATLTLSVSNMPAGAVLNAAQTQLTWTPSAADLGTHTIVFTVTDDSTPPLSASASAAIIVTARVDRLEIVTGALPDATQGQAYNAVLQAAGGVRPYVWTKTSGSLPDGLSLAANGAISGAPTATGAFSFVARVTDDADTFAEATFSIAVAGGAVQTLHIVTAELPDSVVGEPYAVVLKAAGGATPYAWSISSGFLPQGMALNEAGGVISGTATAPTNAFFMVTVTDKNGATDSKPLVIRVRDEEDLNLDIREVSLAKFNINWRKHVKKQEDDCDSLWVKTMFTVPQGFKLEPNVPVTVFLGAYPVDGWKADISPNGRRAVYYQGDADKDDVPVVKMVVRLRFVGGEPMGILYTVAKYADLDGELGAENEDITDGRLMVPVHVLIGTYEGAQTIEMRYDSKKDRKGKGKYPIR